MKTFKRFLALAALLSALAGGVSTSAGAEEWCARATVYRPVSVSTDAVCVPMP